MPQEGGTMGYYESEIIRSHHFSKPGFRHVPKYCSECPTGFHTCETCEHLAEQAWGDQWLGWVCGYEPKDEPEEE